MLSAKALDPRLAEDNQYTKRSRALVKEYLVSSEDSKSFNLDEPDSPVLRPLDSMDDHLYSAELPPLDLDDDSCSDSEDHPADQKNSSCSPSEAQAVKSIDESIQNRTQDGFIKPRRPRLIKDFIDSELRMSRKPEAVITDEEDIANQETWLL